jgi:hypothetical protein
MRIPNAEHERHPWLIAQVAPDFELLDAWRLPVGGNRDEFASLVQAMSSIDPASGDSSRAARALFALRRRIGAWLGWDGATRRLPIPGCTETTLSVRVPEDLRDTTTPPPTLSSTGFIPIYRTGEEWAAEISNSTVHGVLQLGWVEQGEGLYEGRLGVYVKPRGSLGAIYLALIGPFRHLIVYPALMRQIGRAWEARSA